MRESQEFPVGRGAATLLYFYPHQYPWGESCALTVSLLLGFAEADHDGPLGKGVSEWAVAVRLRESRARARCRCTSLYLPLQCIHTYIYSPVLALTHAGNASKES